MSEYQFYEFISLDRPLSDEARRAMRDLSSRVKLSSHGAIFVYNFGDFPGEPYDLMAEHCDAMLYMSNWGTRQIMLRFPENAIPDDVMNAYQYESVIGEEYGTLEWEVGDGYVLLHILLNNEEPDGVWLEGEGTLPGMLPIRENILKGDYRALYMAWLKFASEDLTWVENYAREDEAREANIDSVVEPPVPPNLNIHAAPLENFAEFFKIDSALIRSALRPAPNPRTIRQLVEDSR